MKTGIELIAIERQRQIDVEGYCKIHDSEYENNELFLAAACYAAAKRQRAIEGKVDYGVPNGWPFAAKYWKPSPDNRVRELEKAGGLYLAHGEQSGKDVTAYVQMCANEIDEILNSQP